MLEPNSTSKGPSGFLHPPHELFYYAQQLAMTLKYELAIATMGFYRFHTIRERAFTDPTLVQLFPSAEQFKLFPP